MGNCLKEQLKEQVQNNALFTLEEVLLVVPKNTNNRIRIRSKAKDGNYLKAELRSTSNSVCFCSDANYSDDLGKTIYSGDNFYIKNASSQDVYLALSDKKQIMSIFRYEYQASVQLAPLFANGEFFKYLPDLSEILIKEGSINSKYLSELSSVTNLLLQYNNEAIDFNDISSMTSLQVLNLVSDTIRGDISLLSPLVNLSNLTLTYSSGTSGTLESFLEGLLTNGKTTNIDCLIHKNTNDITFNGIKTQYSKHYIASFGNNSITVTIDNNVIGTFNGSTWTYNS